MFVIPPVHSAFRSISPFRAVLLIAMFCFAGLAANARFSQTLSPANWVGAGFIHLTTPQTQALDALIERDIDSARQGDTVAFKNSFTERLTAEERHRAGVDRLTDTERDRLNAIVAAAIANRPTAAMSQGRLMTLPPREVPIDKAHVTVHGDVSLFVGGGNHGASWYGGGFDVFVTDPTRHITAGFGASEIRGHGHDRDLVPGPIW